MRNLGVSWLSAAPAAGLAFAAFRPASCRRAPRSRVRHFADDHKRDLFLIDAPLTQDEPLNRERVARDRVVQTDAIRRVVRERERERELSRGNNRGGPFEKAPA